MTSGAPASPQPVARLLRRGLHGHAARAAWDRLLPLFGARGYLPDPAGWLAFFALCHRWQIFRRLERVAARWPQHRPLRRAVAQHRLRTRALAAEWYLIAPERVPLAPLNARGEDTELARIFGRARGTRRRATAGALNARAATGPFGAGDRSLSTTRRRQ